MDFMMRRTPDGVSRDREGRRMRHDARRLASLAVIVLLAAGACGDPNPPPTPVATIATVATDAPTATPTPSPSAVDVAAAFIRIIGSPSFSATAVISGTVSLGDKSGSVSGDAILAGPASSQTLRIDRDGFISEKTSIRIGTKQWSRDSPGPWLAAPDATPSQGSLFASPDAVYSVKDLGIVEKRGQQLHQLQPAGGGAISPAAIGFEVGGGTNLAFTIDYFSTNEGTPAIVVVTGSWTQSGNDGASPAEIDLEFALADVGVPQTIAPPEDVWVVNTSKTFPYRMAHPADWTVEASTTEEAYAVDGQPYVYVAAQAVDADTTVESFAKALQGFYKDDFGAPTSDVAASLGGQPAERLVFQFVNDQGQDVTLVDDVTVRGRTGWEVFLVTAGGASDIPVFDQFVATFAFTD
jgi:hypothetical protein